MPPRLRRAGPDDVDALLVLREAMIRSWGQDPMVATWAEEFRAVVRRGMREGTLAAFVVEDDERGVVAGGVGWVEQHLPGPGNPSGRRGHIANMSTLEPARRRGHARAVLHALLDWFTGQGITRVDLRATPSGEPLYRSEGFLDRHGVALTRSSDQ